MSASDYGFFPSGLSGNVYLARRIKNPHTISRDRRVLTSDESIGIFEHFLKRYCKINNTDTLNVTDENDNIVFTATLHNNSK